MSFDKIQEVVPVDWLEQHKEEYFQLCERIMKTIMIAEARNKGWSKPLKELADFEMFIQEEAKDKNLPAEKIRQYLLDAGKIKARNTIFDKYYSDILPKNDKGECIISRKTILRFIKYTVDDIKHNDA